MSKFSKNIAPYVKEEIEKSIKTEMSGDISLSFAHLENAHVLGQESTWWHVKVHWLMLLWGLRQGDYGEFFGQILRVIGAVLLTSVKGVPIGNTGGSNVSPIKEMPINPEHEKIISKAKNA